MLPEWSQMGSRRPLESSLGSGTLRDRFWTDFWWIFEPLEGNFWSKLKAFTCKVNVTLDKTEFFRNYVKNTVFLKENWISPMMKTHSNEMKIEREKGSVWFLLGVPMRSVMWNRFWDRKWSQNESQSAPKSVPNGLQTHSSATTCLTANPQLWSLSFFYKRFDMSTSMMMQKPIASLLKSESGKPATGAISIFLQTIRHVHRHDDAITKRFFIKIGKRKTRHRGH